MENSALTVSYINSRLQKEASNFVRECEQRYRKRLKTVTDDILCRPGNVFVMLAGPSSSGKTTTAKILSESVRQSGRNCVSVSLDDFYLNDEEYPLDKDGTPNYESPQALDLVLIRQCFEQLEREKKTVLPVFSFVQKRRLEQGRAVNLASDDVVVVEGLHALNPLLTDGLDRKDFLKVYISASTRVYKSDEVLLSKRDVRFLRRLIRDDKHRNVTPDETFFLWKKVRKGEDAYLFPYRNTADFRIDTMHAYEPSVIKNQAVRVLQRIEKNSPYYEKGLSYLEKLSYFTSLEETKVPQNSLLMEFIG